MVFSRDDTAQVIKRLVSEFEVFVRRNLEINVRKSKVKRCNISEGRESSSVRLKGEELADCKNDGNIGKKHKSVHY